MDNLSSGEIIPGERIGIFRLGCKVETFKKNLTNQYQIEDREGKYIILEENFKFWVDKTSETITQITVFNKFQGRFKERIGIGSTLDELQRYIGNWQEQFGVYIIPEYPGICFELLDEECWDECKSPIEYISIYNS
ncbi:hypothetical protein [Cytobacillus massiliigabonensis]|uniref:hypothetical protein n=1 Tax=Cytobacillus massiliigabonensis TaxID=1871011 RepID=UPI000C85B534|nr:hypothetical protein [Cytobacillus massiliigabonensis]